MRRFPLTSRSVPTALLITAVTLLASCGTITTVQTASGQPSPAAHDYRISGELANIGLGVGEVRVFRAPGGGLEAQVDVQNTKWTQNDFAYRFTWVDPAGRVLPSQMSVWKPRDVPSGGRTTISSVAPTPNAVDFRLEIRDTD